MCVSARAPAGRRALTRQARARFLVVVVSRHFNFAVTTRRVKFKKILKKCKFYYIRPIVCKKTFKTGHLSITNGLRSCAKNISWLCGHSQCCVTRLTGPFMDFVLIHWPKNCCQCPIVFKKDRLKGDPRVQTIQSYARSVALWQR